MTVELSRYVNECERPDTQSGIPPVVRLRYLPLHRLSGSDLGREPGLEQLIYLQNMIDEDEVAEVFGW